MNLPPKNESITVYEEKPSTPHYYHCKYCKGYILGGTNDRRVDTLAPLSGRRGLAKYCRRCAREIEFTGKKS